MIITTDREILGMNVATKMTIIVDNTKKGNKLAEEISEDNKINLIAREEIPTTNWSMTKENTEITGMKERDYKDTIEEKTTGMTMSSQENKSDQKGGKSRSNVKSPSLKENKKDVQKRGTIASKVKIIMVVIITNLAETEESIRNTKEVQHMNQRSENIMMIGTKRSDLMTNMKNIQKTDMVMRSTLRTDMLMTNIMITDVVEMSLLQEIDIMEGMVVKRKSILVHLSILLNIIKGRAVDIKNLHIINQNIHIKNNLREAMSTEDEL